MRKRACDWCERTDKALEEITIEFRDGRLTLELCGTCADPYHKLKAVGQWKKTRTRRTFEKTSLTDLLEE